MYAPNNPAGRTLEYPTIWSHDDTGWNVLASYSEPGRARITWQAVDRTKAGSSAAARRTWSAAASTDWTASILKAWPLDKGAPPIPNLASLGRAGFQISTLAGNDSTLYAKGHTVDDFKPMVRWLADGKPGEVMLPKDKDWRMIGTTPTALVGSVWRPNRSSATARERQAQLTAADHVRPRTRPLYETVVAAERRHLGTHVEASPCSSPKARRARRITANPACPCQVRRHTRTIAPSRSRDPATPIVGLEARRPLCRSALTGARCSIQEVNGQWTRGDAPEAAFRHARKVHSRRALLMPAKGATST